jgi:hypothetical protein
VAVAWLTGFLDFPPPAFGTAVPFWQAVTGYGLSPARGADGEFATLLPRHGSAYLRVQRVAGGPGGCHLDVHTADVGSLTRWAAGLGATVQYTEDELSVLRSPAGLPFCVSRYEDEAGRPPPARWAVHQRSLVDQICLDIPSGQFDRECSFWQAVTGWEPRPGGEGFRSLARPLGIPLRLLLQCRHDDDGPCRAHLDLACDDYGAEADRHVALGATVVRSNGTWTTLLDPAGLSYCVTRRCPDTGMLKP